MRPAGRSLIGIALVLTLLAAYYAPRAGADGVELSERTRTPRPMLAASAAAPVQTMEVLRIRPRGTGADDEAASDLFAQTRWAIPAPQVVAQSPAAPAQAPVVAPQAPALPFRVLGRYVENGQIAVFLQHNDQNLVVRVGDTVAEVYKVESLNGPTLTLRYLPLDAPQTLDVGGSN